MSGKYAEGELKGQRDFLTRLFKQRFGPLSTPHQERLEQANLEELLTWGENFLDAKTPETVFLKKTPSYPA